MDNFRISKHLDKVSKLLEITEANPFKIRAYENGSRVIRSLKDNAKELLEKGELGKVKGIGKGLLLEITEFIKNGTSESYESLVSEIPQGIFEIFQIKGLGVKKVKVILEKLKISTLGELEYACLENRLVDLDGFGAKTQESVLQSIQFLKRFKGFKLLNSAFQEAEKLNHFLKNNLKPQKLILCGQLKTGVEVVDEIYFLAMINEIELQKFVLEFGGNENFVQLNLKENKIIGTLFSGLNFVVEAAKIEKAGVKTLEKNSPANFLKEVHFSSDECFETEEEFFQGKKLNFVFPEVRHFGVEKAFELSQNLVTEDEILGIFHIHTTWSDGSASLAEMAKETQNLGYSYIGISDHSKSAFYANGLTESRIFEQHSEIEKLNSEMNNFKIFKGIESDILNDGSLDYEDSVLESFDFVIASVHSNFKMTEEEMTKRLIKAIENPYTTMLGHLTGRLLLARPAYKLNMKKIIDACSQNNVCIELNASPHRLDLDWRWMQTAFDKGVKISINPDAHSLTGLQDVKFGIKVARRGGAQKENVLNTKYFETVLENF